MFKYEEIKGYSTIDLQHDYALMLIDNEEDELCIEYRKVLEKRNEPVPVNCRWIYSPYYAFGKRLAYDLERRSK